MSGNYAKCAGDPVYNDDSTIRDWQKIMERPLYPKWAPDTGFPHLRIAGDLQPDNISFRDVPYGPSLLLLECQQCGAIWVDENES